MKSKLVKYPFNDGKRYRWDTYKMGKRFEYTWEQSEPQNYSTITPYIKTEEISDADKYNNEYAILGDDIETPSINNGPVTIIEYSSSPTLHYIRGTAGSDFKLVMVGDDPIEYATFTIATITNTNYNTDWNLTQYDYNYILNNNISADELYALLLTNNPNNDELRHLSFNFNDGFRRQYLYADPEVKIKYSISKDNNTITLNAITGAFKFSNYTGEGANTTHIEFPTIQRIAIGSGEASVEPFQYLYTNNPGSAQWAQPGDQLLIGDILTATRFLRADEYFVGYTVLVRKRYNASEYADNVYYISGNTYTPPMEAWSNAYMSRYPIEFYKNAKVVLIGYADPKTPYNEYSWENPETAYSNFVWVNEVAKAIYSYKTSRYGYRKTGNSDRCLDIYYLRGFDTTDLGRNYYWRYREKATDGTYMTLVPKSYTYGAVEVWDPRHFIGYSSSVNVNNPLSEYNLTHIIKKSDWPSDMDNITNISPIWLGNNVKVLKPDIQLIGDQSADTITVPSGNTTINAYTLGEPTDKQHLNPKSLQINAPCEYEYAPFEPAKSITGIKVNPDFLGLGGPGWADNNPPRDIGDWSLDDIYDVGKVYMLYDDFWLYYPDGSLFFHSHLFEPNSSTPEYEKMLWDNTMAFIANMSPQPEKIYRTYSGEQYLDGYKFNYDTLYTMSDYSKLFTKPNYYNRYYFEPQPEYNYNYETVSDDNGFVVSYKDNINRSFYTKNEYVDIDILCNNNGYVFINSGENTDIDVEWLRHITPVPSKPDINHFPTGRSGFKDMGYMLLPNTEYTIDTEYIIDYLEFAGQAGIEANNNPFVVCIATSRTWLTFNTYTPNQWINGYHFQGNQWNNIGSPWAYAGNITADGDHTMTYVNYEPCPEGTYLSVFSVFNQDETVVEDTLGNTFPTNAQTYYDNIGGLYFWGDDIVKSYVKDAYPQDGYQGKYWYHLRPEDTKFITYTESTDETINVVLNKNRYHLPHTNKYYNRDTSLYGKVVGTPTSTNEDSIPDASWRKYLGLYLGESIPFLGIVETTIPESQILGVPAYDKQINTSETLKYGTVAAASLTFTVNMPVEEAMSYNHEYLILYYDFTHLNDWERMGFFYVDSIESIDENTSRITAHDETYKLNKYVDDFLENYSGEVTLGKFYHDLLDYCDCYYDTKEADWRHYKLNNVYHAIKTTGIEVAHFVAAIAPGFIHTNIDGDIVLEQYENTSYSVGINDYTDLQYTAYNSDLLNKVRITSNNVVVGEDTYNYGSNIYFVSDNPLINTLDAETTLNSLANTILSAYREIPAYRPAEIQFLVLPKPTIGDIFSITTVGGDTYKVIAMGLSVDASGVKIKSLGTQTYPVEAQSNSQFINLINDIDSVSADVDNLQNAQQILGQAINENKENIETLDGRMETTESDISTLTSGLATANNNISTVSTNLQNKINNDNISTSNNLTTIKINGTTANNITNKNYVDSSISSAISNSEAKNRVAEANNLVSVKINNNEVNDIATKRYVDVAIGGGSVIYATGTLSYTGTHSSTTKTRQCLYIGASGYQNGVFLPVDNGTPDENIMFFKTVNGTLAGFYTTTYSTSWATNYTYTFTKN